MALLTLDRQQSEPFNWQYQLLAAQFDCVDDIFNSTSEVDYKLTFDFFKYIIWTTYMNIYNPIVFPCFCRFPIMCSEK